jgi:hypothetical protein
LTKKIILETEKLKNFTSIVGKLYIENFQALEEDSISRKILNTFKSLCDKPRKSREVFKGFLMHRSEKLNTRKSCGKQKQSILEAWDGGSK